MLSNLLADFALRRSREALERHYSAPSDVEADYQLCRAEDWDDFRMWIDGMAPWRYLRRRTHQARLGEHRPALSRYLDVEGVAS